MKYLSFLLMLLAFYSAESQILQYEEIPDCFVRVDDEHVVNNLEQPSHIHFDTCDVADILASKELDAWPQPVNENASLQLALDNFDLLKEKNKIFLKNFIFVTRKGLDSSLFENLDHYNGYVEVTVDDINDVYAEHLPFFQALEGNFGTFKMFAGPFGDNYRSRMEGRNIAFFFDNYVSYRYLEEDMKNDNYNIFVTQWKVPPVSVEEKETFDYYQEGNNLVIQNLKEIVDIEVVSVYGNSVAKYSNINSSDYIISMQDHPSGVYFIVIGRQAIKFVKI